MDQVALQLFARLKIRLRQDKGILLNTQRFFSDPIYAAQALDAAEESEDIDLVTLSLEMRNHLGWIKIKTPQASMTAMPNKEANKMPQTGATENDKSRYVFGARS